jgi:hypothetical protein
MRTGERRTCGVCGSDGITWEIEASGRPTPLYHECGHVTIRSDEEAQSVRNGLGVEGRVVFEGGMKTRDATPEEFEEARQKRQASLDLWEKKRAEEEAPPE